jgi:nucleoside-diphosphate-sugar epimerase
VKILITGSSGYVGQVLSRFFTARGVPVVGLDLEPPAAWDPDAPFRFRRCDVTRRDALADAFREERPTHVLHLAFLMNPLHDAARERAIDVGGSLNVLEESNRTRSVEQLVLLGSTSAYGAWPSHRRWLPEMTPLRPRDYRYGLHKKEVEELTSRFARRSSLRVVTLRMCTAVGPSYRKAGGVVALLANAPILPRFDGRHCELQLLHEEDLTALLDLIVRDPVVEGVFNLAPDSFATAQELVPGKRFLPIPLWLARGVAAILWRLHLSDVMPSAMDLATHGIVADPAKLMGRYGYRFKYDTHEAFRETVRERRALGTL